MLDLFSRRAGQGQHKRNLLSKRLLGLLESVRSAGEDNETLQIPSRGVRDTGRAAQHREPELLSAELKAEVKHNLDLFNPFLV